MSLKALLHYGQNHDKLVGFKEHKKIFCPLKPANLALYSPYCKYGFNLHGVTHRYLTIYLDVEA